MKKLNSLHITFTNGSNPYMTLGEVNVYKELRKWKRHYNVVDRYIENATLFVRLMEKSNEEEYNMRKANREKYNNAKAKAEQEAIDWQSDFNNHNYSWGEIAAWSAYFEKLGKRYGLLTEFRENGIC